MIITRHLVKVFDIGVNNNLYGGRMLDWLDEVGVLFIREQYPTKQFVTLKISETVFHKPVQCNDILLFDVIDYKVGNTSVSLNIDVYNLEKVKVVSTNIVYVSIDQYGNKTPIH